MNRLFIDTSIFIRFFTHDDEKKFEECKQLLELLKSGFLKPYISNIVLAEIVFVLNRQYKFPKDKVRGAIDRLLQIRNLVVIDKTNSLRALKIFADYNIKYQDCLIITQVPRSGKIVTYDKDFKKIKSLTSLTPKDVVEFMMNSGRNGNDKK